MILFVLQTSFYSLFDELAMMYRHLNLSALADWRILLMTVFDIRNNKFWPRRELNTGIVGRSLSDMRY